MGEPGGIHPDEAEVGETSRDINIDKDKTDTLGIQSEEAGVDETSRDNEDRDENDVLEDPGQIVLSGNDDRDQVVENIDICKGDEVIPEVGMVFKTVNEAYDFYNKYAYVKGFGITRNHARRKEGRQYEFTFACAKGGKPHIRQDFRAKRIKKSKKTNCRAKMTIRVHGDGLFYVDYLILEHNHPCTPGKAQLYRSHKYLPLDVKKRLNDNDHTSLTPNESFQLLAEGGDDENVPFTERYCKNFVPRARSLNLEEGDLHVILDYFHRMQKENPCFFYMLDMNEEGRLRNVFWATARSRVSYTYFSDVVLLDTTSIRNKSHMPFATFVGVDHHGFLVLLGAALLSDVRTETYIWLFKAWLACMHDLAPKAIITDQCKEIRNAVSEVFPNSCHRLCLQHILEKVPMKLAGYSKCSEIKGRLDDLVYDSQRVAEFDERWKRMIKEYGLEENDWLKSLYEDRHRWVPVYVKNTFWAGMSSVHRLDSMDSYFDNSVTLQPSLRKFLREYEKALKGKYEREALEDFDSYDKQPILISRLRLEKHLSTLYTSNMFGKFQNELRKCMDCTISLVKKDGPISTYVVYENVQDQTFSYAVVFDEKEIEVQCICCLFEFKGILCAHAIVVLKEMRMHTIPSRYICDRWRKSFKRDYPVRSPSIHVVPGLPMERYNKLYSWCLQLFPNMVEIGAISSDRYEFLLKLLTEAQVKLNEYDSKLRLEAADFGSSIDHQEVVYMEDNQNAVLSEGQLLRKRGLLADEKKGNAQKKKQMGKTFVSNSIGAPSPHFSNLSYPTFGVGTQESVAFPCATPFFGHQEGRVMPAMLYGQVFTQVLQVQPQQSNQPNKVSQQTHPSESTPTSQAPNLPNLES